MSDTEYLRDPLAEKEAREAGVAVGDEDAVVAVLNALKRSGRYATAADLFMRSSYGEGLQGLSAIEVRQCLEKMEEERTAFSTAILWLLHLGMVRTHPHDPKRYCLACNHPEAALARLRAAGVRRLAAG